MIKEFAGKNILITGGLGFIGSNLAHKIAELKPERIMIVDSLVNENSGFKNIKEIKDRIEIYIKDIGDDKIKPLIKDSDFIFNLSGSSKHSRLGEKELAEDSQMNFLSQTLFLEACRQCLIEDKFKKLNIVFAGTRDQYGKTIYEDLPVKEDFKQKNFTDYQSISKNASEAHHMVLQNSIDELGIDARISSARITNTYGPRQSLDSGAVVPTFIKKAILGQVIELWGGGDALRDFNYVEDVVNALLLLGVSGKGTYNLGCCIGKEGMQNPVGNNLTTIKDLAELIAKICGKGIVKIIPYPDDRKNIEPGHCCSDISKISKLGWIPETSLEEGLKKTIKWCKDNV